MTTANPPSTSTGARGARESETATIGASTRVKGRVEGTDDLVVKGQVDGKIKLPGNRVLVARGSRVEADIQAQTIEVEGVVRGQLTGGKSVTVRVGGEVDLHYGDKVFLSPDANRIHGFDDRGLRIE